MCFLIDHSGQSLCLGALVPFRLWCIQCKLGWAGDQGAAEGAVHLQKGDPSYELYAKEREDLLASLKRRANTLFKVLNKLEGVTCNEPQGALYCMPRIRLSPKVAEVHPPFSRSADQETALHLSFQLISKGQAGDRCRALLASLNFLWLPVTTL